MILTYKNNDNKYDNIKQVLKEEFDMSDRFILKLKNNKRIFLNENLAYVYTTLQDKDIIKIVLDFDEDNSNIIPKKMDLDIIYEDDYFLVINKPPCIAIHPSMLHYDNTLSNGIKYYFDSINLKRKIRPVNRLDKDTSRINYFC